MERAMDVTSARRRFGTLLDEVFHKGDVVIIERKGRPLAKIVPITERGLGASGGEPMSSNQKRMLENLNGLPRIGMEQDPVEVLRGIRKQKRAKA